MTPNAKADSRWSREKFEITTVSSPRLAGANIPGMEGERGARRERGRAVFPARSTDISRRAN
jgi:hypothetical protein